jgi:hypothetical protein
VSAADYDLWRTTFGSTSKLAADANQDNVVDAADYVIWRKAFDAAGAGVAAASVPEPSVTAILALPAVLCVVLRIRRFGPR